MSEKIKFEVEVDADSGEATIKGLNDQIEKTAETGEKGFKKMGMSISAIGKASGVFFIIEKALDLIMQVLGENQLLLDAFSTTMNFITIAVNDLISFITDNAGGAIEKIQQLFSVEGIKNFGNAIKDNIIERFNSALDVAGHLGKALQKLFKGDFKGALDSVGDAGKEMVDVFTGVDGSAEKIADGVTKIATAAGEYAKETFNTATAMTKMNKESELAAAQNARLTQQYDIMQEKQRQIRDNTELDMETRMAANEELGRLLEEQSKIQQAEAQKVVDAAKLALDANKDNVEAQVAYIQALTEQDGLEAAVNGRRSEFKMQQVALRKEQADEELAIKEEQLAKEKELEDKRNEDSLKQAELLASAKENIEANAFKAIGALASIFEGANEQRNRRIFQVQKALSIAEATFGTYQAVIGAMSAKGPDGLLPFYVRLANAGIAGAFGAAQIATIARTQFGDMNTPDVTGDAGGAARGSGDGSPSISIIGDTLQTQLADSLNQAPSRAYVVQTDIETQGQLSRRINENATLAG